MKPLTEAAISALAMIGWAQCRVFLSVCLPRWPRPAPRDVTLKFYACFVSSHITLRTHAPTQIDFGNGPPVFTQINYQPRFDWWTIIQDARGYVGGDTGGGVLCTLTLETGLQDAFVGHPIWRTLLPEAHLIVSHHAKAREEEDA